LSFLSEIDGIMMAVIITTVAVIVAAIATMH